jgi:hypothetical protein
MTKEQAADAYLAAIAPAQDVLRAWKAKAGEYTDSVQAGTAATDAKPLIEAFTTLRTKLLGIVGSYPAVASDLKAEITAQATLQGDLQGIEGLNAFNEGDWIQQVAKDASASKAATAIVRSDLGLPPAPTS